MTSKWDETFFGGKLTSYSLTPTQNIRLKP